MYIILWILPNTMMPYLLFNGSSSSWLQFSQKIVNLSLAVRCLSLSLYTWGFSCAQQVRALVLIEAKTHFKTIWLAVVSSEHNNTNHSKQTPLLVSDERYAIAKNAICSQFTLVVSSTKWLALLLLLSRFAKAIWILWKTLEQQNLNIIQWNLALSLLFWDLRMEQVTL